MRGFLSGIRQPNQRFTRDLTSCKDRGTMPALHQRRAGMQYLCKWCGETKDESEMQRRNAKLPYSIGNIRSCKQCNTTKNRIRYKDPTIRAKQLAANATWKEANKERHDRLVADWQKRNPSNTKARNRIGYLLRHGLIQRMSCVICGDPETEGHHDSYAPEHWDDVVWLCKDHHEQWHSVIDPMKRSVIGEPIEKAQEMRRQAAERMKALNKERDAINALKAEADEIEAAAWRQVMRVARDSFPDFCAGFDK